MLAALGVSFVCVSILPKAHCCFVLLLVGVSCSLLMEPVACRCRMGCCCGCCLETQINLLQRVQRCLLAKFGTRHVDASSVAIFGNLPNLRSAGGLWSTLAKSGNQSFGLNVTK